MWIERDQTDQPGHYAVRDVAQSNVAQPDVAQPALARLAWREREIASIVYSLGSATAKDIAARTSSAITDSTARSILRHLVEKGLLDRVGEGKGPGQQIVYVPASTNRVREAILIQMAEQYFGGSLGAAAVMMSELLEREGDRAPLGAEGRSRYKPGATAGSLPARLSAAANDGRA